MTPSHAEVRGQSFQVHGVDGGVYALISDYSLHLNARFAILGGPRRCPTMPPTGHPSIACWTHPGSDLSHIALSTLGGSRLLIVAGDAASGFASVSLDGQSVTADRDRERGWLRQPPPCVRGARIVVKAQRPRAVEADPAEQD